MPPIRNFCRTRLLQAGNEQPPSVVRTMLSKVFRFEAAPEEGSDSETIFTDAESTDEARLRRGEVPSERRGGLGARCATAKFEFPVR